MSGFIKKIVPISVKNYLRFLLFFSKRKFTKMKRIILSNKEKTFYNFAILCVKKIDYVNLAIDNVNSLHLINNNNVFYIYCDNVCYQELVKRKSDFDYQNNVNFINIYKEGEQPWQYYKVKTLIEISKKGYILTDADGFWHQQPKINQNLITLLVKAYKIEDSSEESQLVAKVFGHEEWSGFTHYVTGFVSIPAKFMTSQLANDIEDFTDIILKNSLDFIVDEKKRYSVKRIAEEIAVSLALQKNYSSDKIKYLKDNDGPGNKNILQSFYYGCANNILK